MRIISYDPGLTTGVCIFETGQKLLHSQIPPEVVWKSLEVFGADVVVYEGFYWRQSKTKVDFTPVEVIGIIKEWCRQHDVDVFEQNPGQAKHFFTDARLKERGVYEKGMRHANDATRHMLYFLEFGRGKIYASGTNI